MSTKIITKGFKYISQIFVVKEPEMEIGLPTDVKHVAHIGWEGPSGSAPSWMNEFKSGPEFSATSLGTLTEGKDSKSRDVSPWSSEDFDQSIKSQPEAEMARSPPSTDLPNIPKKHKRKKPKANSSPKSPASRSTRTGKSKATAEKKSNLQG